MYLLGILPLVVGTTNSHDVLVGGANADTQEEDRRREL